MTIRASANPSAGSRPSSVRPNLLARLIGRGEHTQPIPSEDVDKAVQRSNSIAREVAAMIRAIQRDADELETRRR